MTDAGSAGLFKGGKRLLAEGGIRVPAIALWEGTLPQGKTSGNYIKANRQTGELLNSIYYNFVLILC